MMSRETTYERPWVKKFEDGEYLNKWKGYGTILIGGPYSENIGIGEENFTHCMGFFCGIGDVDWWIKDELDKLTDKQKLELELICDYKTYLDKKINIDLVRQISNFYGCETHHIYRTGLKNIIDICNDLTKYNELIHKHSKNDRSEEWESFEKKKNPFNIVSFDVYKKQKDDRKILSEREYTLVVEKFESYLDGGTIGIKTNEGDYYIDGRLKSMTVGKFYKKYPDSTDITSMLTWEEEEKLLPKLIEGLENFEGVEYKVIIEQLIDELKNKYNE